MHVKENSKRYGPGHVQGHIMLLIKTKKKWILLAGDGVYCSKSYNQSVPIAKGTYEGNSVDSDPIKAYETICNVHKFYHMEKTMVIQAHLLLKEWDKMNLLLKFY